MVNDESRFVKRHKFPEDVLREARACSRGDNWHGPLETAEHWAVMAFWILLSYWAWQNVHMALAVPLYLAAVFFVGGRQRALAGVLHQATHRTLMSNYKAGAVIGAVFAGYPLLQSFTGYRASHLGEHHGRLGDPARDPDYLQYQRYLLCGENLSREALKRHLLTIAGLRSTMSYIGYLLRERILTSGEKTRERWFRIVLTAVVVGLAAATGQLDLVLLYWIVPLITTQVWLGSIAELLEHYPVIETAPRIDIYMSWNRHYSPMARFLLGEREGEGYHLVHHLFPRVPLWRLKEVDQILLRDPEYAALQRLEGVYAAMSSIYALLPERRGAVAGGAMT
ncbi:fatty acid desaturase [Actinomadura alba]|nr:fatty acid desaturase [Actinomadura alba]